MAASQAKEYWDEPIVKQFEISTSYNELILYPLYGFEYGKWVNGVGDLSGADVLSDAIIKVSVDK